MCLVMPCTLMLCTSVASVSRPKTAPGSAIAEKSSTAYIARGRQATPETRMQWGSGYIPGTPGNQVLSFPRIPRGFLGSGKETSAQGQHTGRQTLKPDEHQTKTQGQLPGSAHLARICLHLDTPKPDRKRLKGSRNEGERGRGSIRPARATHTKETSSYTQWPGCLATARNRCLEGLLPLSSCRTCCPNGEEPC